MTLSTIMVALFIVYRCLFSERPIGKPVDNPYSQTVSRILEKTRNTTSLDSDVDLLETMENFAKAGGFQLQDGEITYEYEREIIQQPNGTKITEKTHIAWRRGELNSEDESAKQEFIPDE